MISTPSNRKKRILTIFYKMKVFLHESAWDVMKLHMKWEHIIKTGDMLYSLHAKQQKHLHPTPTTPLPMHNFHPDSSTTMKMIHVDNSPPLRQ